MRRDTLLSFHSRPLQRLAAFAAGCSFLAAFVFALAGATPAHAQTFFKKTYTIAHGPEVSCCQNGMSYGFTPVLHDASISGNVEIFSITATANASVKLTDPNGIAGMTWEIFLGPSVADCGFPVGQQHAAFIDLTTYTCSASLATTQLIFNTNGVFNTAPTAGHYEGGYDFPKATFKANDLGQLVSETTAPAFFADGLSLQVLNWSGDQGADLQMASITITVAGAMQ
jgi:hypothetical protein